MKICLATHNLNKVKELSMRIPSDWEIVSLSELGCTEEIPETEDTFEGNASIKSRYVFNKYGIPCISDDSGLCVDALGGAPGVYSARFAADDATDAQNLEFLLYKMQMEAQRSASFVTVISYMDENGNEHFFKGSIEGTLLTHPRGDFGFGYDPIFVPNGYNRTFAEMKPEEKTSISHRSKAFQNFIEYLLNTKSL